MVARSKLVLGVTLDLTASGADALEVPHAALPVAGLHETDRFNKTTS